MLLAPAEPVPPHAARPEPDARSRRRGPLAPWWWVGLAAVAGLATGAGFAPIGLWPSTLVGVAALTVSVTASRTRWLLIAAGAAFGLGLTTSTLSWMAMITVGAAAGLIAVVSSWYILLAVLLRLCLRAAYWPLLSAGAWVLVEYAASTFPFGGFGWLRLGYAMLDSPLVGLLPLVGVGGLSLATALAANLVVWVALKPARRRAVLAGGSVTLLLLIAAAAGTIEVPAAGTSISVGWVQGGAPGGGVFGLGPAGSTTRRHADETNVLAARIASGELPQPDVVLWPENSTDTDPNENDETRDLIVTSSSTVNAPVLVGEILEGPGSDNRRTASQLWTASGAIGRTYVKRSIVPFGEWIPYRDLLLPLVPELRYVGKQSVPGEHPGVLPLKLRSGADVDLGVLICFDVAFDPVVYDLPGNGARVIVVQSSNAMYQGSAQVLQQFAITRARAAELRREIVVATTSGISGVIDTHGTPIVATGSGAASGVQTLPLRNGVTPAVVIALPLQQAVSAATGGWALLLWIGSRYGRRARGTGQRSQRRAEGGSMWSRVRLSAIGD